MERRYAEGLSQKEQARQRHSRRWKEKDERSKRRWRGEPTTNTSTGGGSGSYSSDSGPVGASFATRDLLGFGSDSGSLYGGPTALTFTTANFTTVGGGAYSSSWVSGGSSSSESLPHPGLISATLQFDQALSAAAAANGGAGGGSFIAGNDGITAASLAAPRVAMSESVGEDTESVILESLGIVGIDASLASFIPPRRRRRVQRRGSRRPRSYRSRLSIVPAADPMGNVSFMAAIPLYSSSSASSSFPYTGDYTTGWDRDYRSARRYGHGAKKRKATAGKKKSNKSKKKKKKKAIKSSRRNRRRDAGRRKADKKLSNKKKKRLAEKEARRARRRAKESKRDRDRRYYEDDDSYYNYYSDDYYGGYYSSKSSAADFRRRMRGKMSNKKRKRVAAAEQRRLQRRYGSSKRARREAARRGLGDATSAGPTSGGAGSKTSDASTPSWLEREERAKDDARRRRYGAPRGETGSTSSYSSYTSYLSDSFFQPFTLFTTL